MEIRDSRLYRESHGTFEEYCQQKWQMSKAFAFRQIAAAKAIENLSPIGDTPKPKTESQARPLTKLPPEQQAPAWEKAVEIARRERVRTEMISIIAIVVSVCSMVVSVFK